MRGVELIFSRAVALTRVTRLGSLKQSPPLSTTMAISLEFTVEAQELSPSRTRAVINLLEPLLPSSLPIFALLSTPLGASTTVYLSCPLEHLDHVETFPDSFCIAVTRGKALESARFYCNAEAKQATSDGYAAFVREFFFQWIRMMAVNLPPSGTVFVGSLDDRWVGIFKLWADYVGPCVKYIRAPIANPVPPETRMDLSTLNEEDVEYVRGTSHIPRAREYLLSRLPYSLAIREDGELAAWGLVHEDGSIGTVYVEEKYRRRGLAKVITQELLRQNVSVLEKAETPGLSFRSSPRWCNVDVSAQNQEGHALFSRLDGWERGWCCSWVRLHLTPMVEARKISEELQKAQIQNTESGFTGRPGQRS